MVKPLYTVFLFVVLPFFVMGQVIVLGDENKRSIGGDDLLVYKSDTSISIDSALNAPFYRPNANIPNLGVTRGQAWVRFTVENASKEANHLLKLANPNYDEVVVYRFLPNMELEEQLVISKHVPFGDRKYQDPNYLFDLGTPSGEQRFFYISVKSRTPLIIPMSILLPEQHINTATDEQMLSGIYIGVILIMAVYNFLLFLSVLDKSYLYYVGYVLAIGLTQMGLKGVNFQFLWPDSPGFEQVSVVLFASIAGVAALIFTINFLEIKTYFRRIHFLLLGLVILFCVAIVVLMFDNYLAFMIMQSATTLTAVSVLVVAIYVAYNRPKATQARFFAWAWSVLLVGSLIFMLKDYGLLPYNMFTVYSVQAASTIEMALLSFALANKINVYKKEKEESQEQALLTLKENERLVREQNVVLEQRVQERTHALQETNTSLQDALNHLKETQAQLVEAEKMASLGQLTAGVAHEINNPINFVTSNVAPLKRDIGIVWDVIETIQQVALSDLTVAEKERRINTYREEQDIEYLKTEIDFLLKGMHEGANRTAEIVKSLRIFSRVDEDSLKFADINEGLESTLVILNSVIREGIQVNKQYAELPFVECYPGKLNQVFLNIITNAVYAINKKFNGSTGGILEISTGIDGNNVFISIQDNGTGMREDIREKIFEPFFTTKEVGEGTGLGMSIVYNTIKKHKGEIKIESREGEGTEIILIIPLMQQIG